MHIFRIEKQKCGVLLIILFYNQQRTPHISTNPPAYTDRL